MGNMTEEIEEEKEAPPTLEEALGAKYDEIQARDTAPPEPVKEHEIKVETVEKTDTKKRGDDGKFVKAEKSATDATPEKEIKADEGKEGAQGLSVPTSQAPASWSAPAKALWESLPPDVKAEAHRLERETQKALGRLSHDKKRYEGLETILAPRRARLAADYGDEATAIKQLFALSDYAEKDPMGFVQMFVQRRGLDLSSLTNQRGEQPQNPNNAALNPHIQALMGKVNSLESFIAQQKKAEENAMISKADELYQAFANDPKNIYFNEVKEDMADLLQAGAAKDYADAYNKAVWANPATREKLFAEQANAEAVKRQKEAEEKAKEAKRVQATNVATRGVHGSSPSTPLTIDETLSRTWDAIHGAA